MLWDRLVHQISFLKIAVLAIIIVVIPANANAEGNDIYNDPYPTGTCTCDDRKQSDTVKANYPRLSFEYDAAKVKTFSLSTDGDLPLSKNFTVSEFRCLDGSDIIIIDLGLVVALQYIRDYFNAPLHINSAYRTKEHNTNIGGSYASYNLYGRGVDFYVKGISNEEVASLAEHIGIKGIIVFSDSKHSLHIDSRTTYQYGYYSHQSKEHTDALSTKDGRYFSAISIERLSCEHYSDKAINHSAYGEEEADNSEESD